MDQQQLITSVVQEVLRAMAPGNAPAPGSASGRAPTNGSASARATGGATNSGDGLFGNVDAAVDAATRAQQQLAQAGLTVRKGIEKLIKQIVKQNAAEWGRIELDETKIGRLDHKIAKLELLEGIPGVDFLQTRAHSGDNGIALDEAAPWGVIGVITPVTHSVPTMTANAIAMIAARRVSSAAIKSTLRKVSNARSVMSCRLPIGVATR